MVHDNTNRYKNLQDFILKHVHLTRSSFFITKTSILAQSTLSKTYTFLYSRLHVTFKFFIVIHTRRKRSDRLNYWVLLLKILQFQSNPLFIDNETRRKIFNFYSLKGKEIFILERKLSFPPPLWGIIGVHYNRNEAKTFTLPFSDSIVSRRLPRTNRFPKTAKDPTNTDSCTRSDSICRIQSTDRLLIPNRRIVDGCLDLAQFHAYFARETLREHVTHPATTIWRPLMWRSMATCGAVWLMLANRYYDRAASDTRAGGRDRLKRARSSLLLSFHHSKWVRK